MPIPEGDNNTFINNALESPVLVLNANRLKVSPSSVARTEGTMVSMKKVFWVLASDSQAVPLILQVTMSVFAAGVGVLGVSSVFLHEDINRVKLRSARLEYFIKFFIKIAVYIKPPKKWNYLNKRRNLLKKLCVGCGMKSLTSGSIY